MFVSVSLILHLVFLHLDFLPSTSAVSHTINKACTPGSTICGLYEECINGLCECSPKEHRFWAGDRHGCRVCPREYVRSRSRCYRFYPAAKNRSDARADCRRSHADLFTWRDNTDENELLTASTREWGFNYQSVTHQFYSWSGGIVHHSRGPSSPYKITWIDPKGPTIGLPTTNDPLTNRFCTRMMISNYEGSDEPTRRTLKNETENCVTFVFLPRPSGRGDICMADDYCSTRMSYICEMTEASLSSTQERPTETESTSIVPPRESLIVDQSQNDAGGKPSEIASALEEKNASSSMNTVAYVGAVVVIALVIGGVAFVVLRRRKRTLDVSPTHSTASSMISTGGGPV